ncbi:hypothetical protein T10_4759 [Trichinella papuae]|uniref:Uncharacterized protein n=1 Tax=Trichinella papuae TaxID=268474 RepID=A0A0V1MG29_9BILA|nr:hypothetical protein T10_4759 [Trichinella papuae]
MIFSHLISLIKLLSFSQYNSISEYPGYLQYTFCLGISCLGNEQQLIAKFDKKINKCENRKNQQESVVNRYGYNNMIRRLARRKSYWPVVLAVDGRAVVWFWFDLSFSNR